MINILFVILSVVFYFKSKTRIYSAIIFFFYVFDGFQLLSYDFLYRFLFLSKSFDYAILITLIIFFIDINKNVYIMKNNKQTLFISLFLIFIISNIVFSIVIYSYDVKNVIRASRHFFLLTSIFYFTRFSLADLFKIFKILIFITLFLSFLYVLQYPLQRVLFGGGIESVTVNQYEFGSRKWNRFYNIPYFIYPVIFYYYFVKKNYKILFFLFIVVLLPLHRTLIFALLLTFLIIRNTNSRRMSNYFVIAIIILLMLQVDVFYSRLISGIVDFTDALSSNKEVNNNTLYFRLMHFYERFLYIIKNNKIFYGLGFITEDTAFTQRQIFKYGLLDDQGNIIQIDTGDFSWSLFIIKLGIVGTLFFIFIYFNFVKNLKTIKTKYKQIFIAFLFLSFFVSFASISLYNYKTYVILCFLYIIVLKAVKQKKNEPINFNNYTII